MAGEGPACRRTGALHAEPGEVVVRDAGHVPGRVTPQPPTAPARKALARCTLVGDQPGSSSRTTGVETPTSSSDQEPPDHATTASAADRIIEDPAASTASQPLIPLRPSLQRIDRQRGGNHPLKHAGTPLVNDDTATGIWAATTATTGRGRDGTAGSVQGLEP